MLMMNVYRQQAKPYQISLADCLRAAATEADHELIGVCMKTRKPVMVGLDSQTSIVKPVDEGDGALSFESLYDTCITLADLTKMKAAKVQTPEEIPLEAYRVEVETEIDGIARISLALFAKNIGDVRRQVRDLLKTDVAFRTAFYRAVLQVIAARMASDEAIIFCVVDTTQALYEEEAILPPLSSDGPRWRFLDPD